MVEGTCQYRVYLESPRVTKVVTIDRAWEYYEMRSVRSNCPLNTDTSIPTIVTVHLSPNLKGFYECKGVKSFFEGNNDVIRCRGGLLISRGIKKVPIGFYIITRIDVIGPRLKALTCRPR